MTRKSPNTLRSHSVDKPRYRSLVHNVRPRSVKGRLHPASRRKDYLSKTACGIPNTLPTHMRGRTPPLQGGRSAHRKYALRGSVATSSRVESARVCLGSHLEVVRNASMVIETGLAEVSGRMAVCGAAVIEGSERSADGMGLSTSPTLITDRRLKPAAMRRTY